MKEVLKSIDELYGHMRPEVAVRAVLWEVSNQAGRPVDLHESSDDLYKMKDRPFYVHVQAAARYLSAMAPTERLAAINTLMASVSRFSGSHAWISAQAAEQIADFALGASRVRCAFGWSLHPALIIGLRAINEGYPVSITFVDLSRDVCELAALCSAALGVGFDIVNRIPFARIDEMDYDVEISLPPFNWNISSIGSDISEKTFNIIGYGFSGRLYSEPVAIVDAIAHASSAKVILGLSAGALFRAVGVEAATREELLKSKRISAILGVPSGMIYIDTGVTASILVINPKKFIRDTVRFIDLSHDHFVSKNNRGRHEARTEVRWRQVVEAEVIDAPFARDVSLSEIHEQGDILTVDRYLRAGDERLSALLARYESKQLTEVAELIRPVALPKVEEGAYFARESSPGDIGENGYLGPSSRVVAVDRGGLRKARNQQLLPGDLVLSVKGTIGRVGLVPEAVPDREADDFWAVGQSMMILRPDTRIIAPEVLYEYLSSDLMQGYLRALAGGAVIQQINMQDLRAIPVPVPPKARQHEIQQAFHKRQELHEQVIQLQDSIRQMRQAGWPDGGDR